MQQSAHQRLIDLHAKHGVLTPEIVVEDAKSKASPLHESFEWDVKKAAQQHWLETARGLIRAVRLQIVNEHTVLSAPYFVRDPRLPTKQQGYMAVSEVRSDSDLARETVADECARAAAAFRRAQEVASAVGVDNDLLQLFNQTVALGERVRSTATEKV